MLSLSGDDYMIKILPEPSRPGQNHRYEIRDDFFVHIISRHHLKLGKVKYNYQSHCSGPTTHSAVR
jgi:hypothetical protein